MVAAVALATGLSVAVAAIGGTLDASFRLSLGRMAGLTDLEVRNSYGAYLDQTLLNEIRAWPEVALASARLDAGARLIDLNSNKSFTGLTQGVDPGAEAELHPQDLAEGRWLRGPGEIVLDPGLAAKLNAKLGDVIEARSGISADLMGSIADMMLGHVTPSIKPATQPGGTLQLQVVGLVSRPHLPILQRPTGYVALTHAQQLLGVSGKVESIQIELKSNANANAVADARRSGLPPGVEINVEAAAASGVQRALSASRLLLLLMMVPVFLSAGFIILTSLTTAVTQRARELGILRCIGASRGQIGAAQLLSGAMLAGAGGLAALPVGLLVGYLFYRHFIGVFKAGFEPDWGIVGVAVGAAIVTGLLAGIYPALRAAFVRPLEALAARAHQPSGRGLWLCLAIGLACVLVEPAALWAIRGPEQSFWFYVCVGVPLLFAGFFLLSVPVLVGCTWVLSPGLSVSMRLPRSLLSQNVAATPYRHGFTGGAMMVGLAMLVVIWTNGRGVLGDWFAHMRMPDAFVHSFFAMSDMQWQDLQHVEGLAELCPTTMFPVETQGVYPGKDKSPPTPTLMVSMEPRAFLDMISLTWLQGDPDTALAKMEAGPALLVSREYMVAHGAGLGSHIMLNTPAQGLVDFEVVGVVTSPGLEVAVQFFGIRRYYSEAAVVSIFASRENAIRYFGTGNINLVLLKFKPQYPENTVIKAIQRNAPGVIVGSSEMVRGIVHAVLEGFMRVASALAALTLVIACFGVGNLVLANLAARQFEYGVLRAVGAERWLLGRLVAAESLLVALTGCVVGTGLGLEISCIEHELFGRLLGLEYGIHLPWDVLGYGWAAVAGVALAASLPGLWRLVRMHPREMLAGE